MDKIKTYDDILTSVMNKRDKLLNSVKLTQEKLHEIKIKIDKAENDKLKQEELNKLEGAIEKTEKVLFFHC